jgi:hypothetical protein
LKLHYGKGGKKLGGFLANAQGNLIDLNGTIIASIDEMSKFLKNNVYEDYDTDK